MAHSRGLILASSSHETQVVSTAWTPDGSGPERVFARTYDRVWCARSRKLWYFAPPGGWNAAPHPI